MPEQKKDTHQKKVSFPKQERLYRKNEIEATFKNGKSFVIFPLKFLYLQTSDSNERNAILFTVPKRNFKRAVDRNLLKRRLREAYRLQKQQLLPSGLKIAVIYLAKEKLDFNLIQTKLISGLNRLIKETSSVD